MNNTEHTILCGGINPAGLKIRGTVMLLNLWPGTGTKQCVRLKIEDLHEQLCALAPIQFHDLVEIAAYVYCADQLASRGGKDVDTFGAHWRRRFHFHIPVRAVDRWNTPAVKDTLRQLLEFLSDDFYDFTFYPAKNAPGIQKYLGLDEKGALKFNAERVVMFSGGLDSLAGAIEETVNQKHRLVLVNHRSTEKFAVMQRELVRLLAEKAGPDAFLHLRVRISKAGLDGKSYTQRARSFLFCSVGATVAMMLGIRSVRFYENGVVSLNLPVCAQVIGSRATRTTHPRVLAGMQSLLTALAGEPFTVDNPFSWETKGEVIHRITKAGCEKLIEQSRSCAHTWETSNEHTHCGTCSQCIDRRFGMLAAKAEAFDPLEKYKLDIFTQSRPKDEDKIMGATYLERANQVRKMNGAEELLEAHPEVLRVLPFLKLEPKRGAERIFDLYRRHAEEVNAGVDVMLARYARELRQRTLPGDSLLWTVYAPNGVNVTPATPLPAPSASAADTLPRYFIRKELGVWRIRVDGKETVAQDCRGMELVAWLLMNPPDEAIHASVLENHVDGDSLADGAGAIDFGDDGNTQAADVGGAIVEIAGKKLKGKMSLPELKLKLAAARKDMNDQNLSQSERDEAEEELNTLLQAYDRGGKVSGQAEMAAERVRKAIRNLINELKAAKRQQGLVNVALSAFGEHLEQNLWLPSMGGKNRVGASGKPGCFIYEPPAGVRWKD